MKEGINLESKQRERKSEKYKNFPNATFGSWGPEVRENTPDKLHDSILARIKHVSDRINSYIDTSYKVDQSISFELENSFSELADLYLEISKEGYGGYLKPENKDGSYSYEPIQKFDEKLEEIHTLVIEGEGPLFDERENRVFDKNEGDKGMYREAVEEEKIILHKEGEDMLKESISKIKLLIGLLESRSLLN